METNELRIFQEKTTTYIKSIAKKSNPIKSMYFRDSDEVGANLNTDILKEKANSPVKGLVYKFHGRVLIMLTYTCLANCRYCERQGRIGVGIDKENHLSNTEIDEIVRYLQENKEINEVIVSGGDPLMHTEGLAYLADELSKNDHIDILRIKTRVPMQDPSKINYSVLEEIANKFETLYFALHIDHPDEFTEDSMTAIKKIRKIGYILLGQSIFLKGINNNIETLYTLFSRMSILGIRPYYIYHCQELPNTMQYVMDIDEERAMMTCLREQLSGIAFPMHVIDMQNTAGKVIVPTNHWESNVRYAKDYYGVLYDLKDYLPINKEM